MLVLMTTAQLTTRRPAGSPATSSTAWSPGSRASASRSGAHACCACTGRKSGEIRTCPVNLLTLDGTRYLVAPRGETQWVRNLRAAGGNGELALGKQVEPFHATELTDADKPPLLRAYLKRWKAEVGVFFDGVSADSPARRRRAHRAPAPRLPPRRLDGASERAISDAH